MEQLRLEKLQIESELKSLGGPQQGLYFPPPGQNRRDGYDDRGDHNMRGGRGGRGRGRGRGGGRRWANERHAGNLSHPNMLPSLFDNLWPVFDGKTMRTVQACDGKKFCL